MTATLVVDTSAAVAILTGERTAEELIESLDRADARLMSTVTLVELGIVMEARLGPAGGGIVERFVRDGDIELVPAGRRWAGGPSNLVGQVPGGVGAGSKRGHRVPGSTGGVGPGSITTGPPAAMESTNDRPMAG